MDIYVVQPGDNINSIADRFGVSVTRLIQDNELDNPNELIPGQTIVIVYPAQTHTVQEGDSLTSIAEAYGVTTMQLLRNNPYLSGREYIYPDETLVVSYNTRRSITTNGFSYPYIKRETLLKVLPSLTYLTIINYRVTENGGIITYADDSEIIQTAKNYGVVPFMLTSTLTPRGEFDIETSYNILLNEENQERYIVNVLNILKSKGYYGLNMTISNINTINQSLYVAFVNKISSRIKSEGFLFLVTINLEIINIDNEIRFERVDYSRISEQVDSIIFLQFVWGTYYGPPEPVSNINYLNAFIDYAASIIPPDKIVVGKPLIAYDWLLPYVPGRSRANSLTLDAALNLADVAGVTMQFDEISQTPYFIYSRINYGAPAQSIVWSIDARSIEALKKLVDEYNLNGIAIWNIMVYYPQLWLLIHSQFDIIKVL